MKREYQKACRSWFQRMATLQLSPQQRQNLEAWERANLDGHSVATSDWPGWIALIGRPPWKFAHPETMQ